MTTTTQLNPWQGGTPPEPAQHPARYSAAILPVLAAALAPAEEFRRVLDPFAGVGGIHALREFGHHTTGVELEPEWARQHPDTLVGDSRRLGDLFTPGEFDAIATSPAYGNRMADHHNARDDSYRRTYRHLLGRPLSDGNGGGLQWGDSYRDLHAQVWAAAVPLIRPGGRFVLNCRDHTRAGVRQEVTAWHLETLAGLGLDLIEAEEVTTPGFRFGANSAARWPEVVAILHRPHPPRGRLHHVPRRDRLPRAATGEPTAAYVGRGSRWGNPHPLAEVRTCEVCERDHTRTEAVALYRAEVLDRPDLWDWLAPLAGLDALACSCPPGAECHADVLLELLELGWPR